MSTVDPSFSPAPQWRVDPDDTVNLLNVRIGNGYYNIAIQRPGTAITRKAELSADQLMRLQQMAQTILSQLSDPAAYTVKYSGQNHTCEVESNYREAYAATDLTDDTPDQFAEINRILSPYTYRTRPIQARRSPNVADIDSLFPPSYRMGSPLPKEKPKRKEPIREEPLSESDEVEEESEVEEEESEEEVHSLPPASLPAKTHIAPASQYTSERLNSSRPSFSSPPQAMPSTTSHPPLRSSSSVPPLRQEEHPQKKQRLEQILNQIPAFRVLREYVAQPKKTENNILQTQYNDLIKLIKNPESKESGPLAMKDNLQKYIEEVYENLFKNIQRKTQEENYKIAAYWVIGLLFGKQQLPADMQNLVNVLTAEKFPSLRSVPHSPASNSDTDDEAEYPSAPSSPRVRSEEQCNVQ